MQAEKTIQLFRSLPLRFQEAVASYVEFLVEKAGYGNSFEPDTERSLPSPDKNRKSILALAGSWTNMLQADFDEYLSVARDSGDELFNRDVEL